VVEAGLLEAARTGSSTAFGVLYAHYRSFAIGVARRALAPAEVGLAEDVAEVAFLRVLSALRNGHGPTDTLRSYLATTVRRETWRAMRRARRQAEVVDRWAVELERTGPDRTALAPVRSLPAPHGELGANVLLGEAFHGLSERWRHVLWLTEVEGRKPAEVAPMLGLSAGSVSALAYRARNGLLTAYLSAYGRTASGDACRALADELGRYLAAGSPPRGFDDVRDHLAGCTACRELCRGIDVASS
jgi:RNA polymerase sigma factor (sigma-70 family)